MAGVFGLIHPAIDDNEVSFDCSSIGIVGLRLTLGRPEAKPKTTSSSTSKKASLNLLELMLSIGLTPSVTLAAQEVWVFGSIDGCNSIARSSLSLISRAGRSLNSV